MLLEAMRRFLLLAVVALALVAEALVAGAFAGGNKAALPLAKS